MNKQPGAIPVQDAYDSQLQGNCLSLLAQRGEAA